LLGCACDPTKPIRIKPLSKNTPPPPKKNTHTDTHRHTTHLPNRVQRQHQQRLLQIGPLDKAEVKQDVARRAEPEHEGVGRAGLAAAAGGVRFRDGFVLQGNVQGLPQAFGVLFFLEGDFGFF
jgi:hypothetical protein